MKSHFAIDIDCDLDTNNDVKNIPDEERLNILHELIS